jgi:uncharacterized protein YhdP
MARRRKWSFLWILIPIIAVGIFIIISAYYLLDPNLYRKILQESLTSVLGREVTIGQAKISLWKGVGIDFEDLRLKDRSLSFDLFHSKRLILKVKIFPLLKGEVKWKRIILEQPAFHLYRDKNEQFNFLDRPLTGKEWKASQQKIFQSFATLFGGSLTLREGEIFFSDESLGNSPLTTEIRSFNLQLSKVSYDKPFPFRLNGKLRHSKKEGQFSVVGTIQNIPDNMDLSKGKVEAELEIKGVETFHFWPYLKRWLPMEKISGDLTLHAHYQGDFSGVFKTSGKIKLKELVFDYPKVFSYVLTPEWVNIGFDVNYDMKDLRVPQISIELPEIGVKGKGKIYGIGSKEMGLEAEAQSAPFDLLEAKKFIPYRIITPKVSGPLFRAEGNGPVQILSVKLSGKIPEIEHCDQPLHAHTLSVEIKANGARLKLPWKLPPLEDLQGHLVFKDGHLNLREVEGKFLHSSIDRANGIFYRLLLVPTLQMDCEGRFDLMDLQTLTKIEGLSSEFMETHSSMTSLSGRADYRLLIKGDLKPLRLQHQGSYHLSKVRFTHRRIPFPILIGEGRIELSNEVLQWSGAKVEFENSSLITNGLWRKEGNENPLEMMAKGRVDLKNLLSLSQSPLFSEEIRLKTKEIEDLSGTGQFSFKGSIPKETRHLSYEGELRPKEVHLLLKGISSPLIFKDGGVSFSNLGVGFSKMKVQSEMSSLTWDGFIKEGNVNLTSWGFIDLKQLFAFLKSSLAPDRVRSQVNGIQELSGKAEVRLRWLGKMDEWITSMREGKIRLKGVSFQHQKIPCRFSQIEGFLVLSPEEIYFKALKGMLADSPFTISGNLARISSGRLLSFQVFSPQLDFDSIFPKREKSTPPSFKKLRDWLLNWNIVGKIEVNQGKYRGLHYQDLKGEMKTNDEKLFLHSFQFKGDGGDLWGEGWIQPTDMGIRFEIKPRVSNMEVNAFLRTLFQKGEEERVAITGRIHIDRVELRGEGEDFQRVKESLNGKLRIEMENGVIERFNILAKIFSILNVSQLLKGRFPDLKTKGLPYHQITANIHIKDGIASIEDFLVDSDAMRITLLGKIDVARNLIDAKIGIHPLVTLDSVLSKVPLAGYILTGKDKAFLSYVYEVKGDLGDPKIEAIPIKGLEENFWGIMKRLLETPFRPFQKAPSSKEK